MNQDIDESEKNPLVFISYSHDSDDHRNWVIKLAVDLIKSGVKVILDQWDLKLGADAVQFMTHSVMEADRVLMICTEKYVAKVNEGKGGVGVEAMIVSGQLIKDLTTTKFIPVVRQQKERVLPDLMSTKLFIDFSNDQNYDRSFDLLLRELHNTPSIPKPNLGPNPFRHTKPIPVPYIPIQKTNNYLIDLLKEPDVDDFIRAFFRKQLTLSSLDDVCEEQPDLVIELLPKMPKSEWGIMIAHYLASRLQDRVEDFLAIAFNSGYHYGTRVEGTQYIKYSRKAARRRAESILLEHFDDTEIDNGRMVLFGLGALGSYSTIDWFVEKHGVLSSKYKNEKFGSIAIESLLSAYINTTDEDSLKYYPDKILKIYNKTSEYGNLQLQSLDFFYIMRNIPKSRVQLLLETFDPIVNKEVLLGLLFTTHGSSNRYITSRLNKLSEYPDLKTTALIGIAAAGTAFSHNLLKSFDNDHEAAAAICYSIGLHRAHDEIEFLLKNKTPLSYQFAVWSLGELALEGNTQALQQLRSEVDQYSDGYIRALALLGLAKAGEITEDELRENIEVVANGVERMVIGIAGIIVDSLELLENGVLALARNYISLWSLRSYLLNDLRKGLQKHHPEMERDLAILLKA